MKMNSWVFVNRHVVAVNKCQVPGARCQVPGDKRRVTSAVDEPLKSAYQRLMLIKVLSAPLSANATTPYTPIGIEPNGIRISVGPTW